MKGDMGGEGTGEARGSGTAGRGRGRVGRRVWEEGGRLKGKKSLRVHGEEVSALNNRGFITPWLPEMNTQYLLKGGWREHMPLVLH